MTPLAKSLNVILDEGAQVHFERQRVMRGLWINVLAAMHPFLLGPPGTNKSRLARWVKDSTTNVRWWETLFNNQLSIDDIYGPPDMVAFDKQGVWKRRFEGRFAWCDLGLGDEVFKANGAVRTPMLSTLNERLAHIDDVPVQANLISLIMASNEMFEDQESGAFWDRRGCGYTIDYIQEAGNFEKLLRMAAGRTSTTISNPTTVDITDLRHAVEVEVPAVDVPQGILDALQQLKTSFEHPTDSGPQIIMSDRRWFQLVRLVQASAYLAGRSVCDDDDLQVAQDFGWETPEMIPHVVSRVMTLASPHTAAAQKISEQVDEISAHIDSLKGQSSQAKAEYGAEANGKIRKAFAEISDLEQQAHSAGRSTTRIEEVKDSLTHLRRKVFVECLGVPAEAAEKV